MKTHFAILLISIFVSGCAGVESAADRYSIYGDNITALQAYDDIQVNVGPFTADFIRPIKVWGKVVSQTGHSEIRCLVDGLVKPPDGDSFAEYIRKAFISELSVADMYSPESSVTLTGALEKINFSRTRAIGAASLGGIWEFQITVHSSTGNSVTISDSYSYRTQWQPSSCDEMAASFMPGIQSLILQLITSDKFESLVN